MSHFKNNRTLILLAASINLFLVTTVSIFSVFSLPMTRLFAYSSSDFAFSYSLYQLSLAVVGIIAGRMVDKYGAKVIVTVGVILYAAGYILTGFTTEIWQLYLTYGIIAGSGAGAIYNPCVTTALRWFPDQRGRISGILFAFASLSPFLFSPLANNWIEHLGVISTYQLFGGIFFVVMIPVTMFLHSAPKNYAPPGTPNKPTMVHYSERELTWNQMLKTKQYYLLLIIFVASATTGNLLIGANATIAQSQIGMNSALAAWAVSATSLANLFGRLSFGFIYDKFHDFRSLLLIFFLTILSLLGLYFANSEWVYFLCVSLLGFAFGGVVVIFSPITSRYFGVKNMGVNYGFMFLGYAISAFVGPQIAAYFRDHVGSFFGAYLAAFLVIVVGLIALFILYRPKKENANS